MLSPEAVPSTSNISARRIADRAVKKCCSHWASHPLGQIIRDQSVAGIENLVATMSKRQLRPGERQAPPPDINQQGAAEIIKILAERHLPREVTITCLRRLAIFALNFAFDFTGSVHAYPQNGLNPDVLKDFQVSLVRQQVDTKLGLCWKKFLDAFNNYKPQSSDEILRGALIRKSSFNIAVHEEGRRPLPADRQAAIVSNVARRRLR